MRINKVVVWIVLLLGWASANVPGYDIFNFGIDRIEARAIAEEHGWTLGTFSTYADDFSLRLQSDWCTTTKRTPPINHCSVSKDHISLYLRFNDSWAQLYAIGIYSHEADAIEALQILFGEPHTTQEETTYTSYLWFVGNLIYEGKRERPGAMHLGEDVLITYVPLAP